MNDEQTPPPDADPLIVDAVATSLPGHPPAPSGSGMKRPVVSFEGWVQPDTAQKVTRIYPDSWFRAWLEIPSADVVYTLVPAERPGSDGRSVIWVTAGAQIVSCSQATAETVASASPDAPIEGFAGGGRLPWPPGKPVAK